MKKPTCFNMLAFLIATFFILHQGSEVTGQTFPVTVIDQTPTAPLSNPVPSSFQPRYISGFGQNNAFTVFFEDRDNGNRISFTSTTTGPSGFPSAVTQTTIIPETHFVIKDWPITIGSTTYAYRTWGSVGNNPSHKFYVSNDLVNWTLVSIFTIPNAPGFTTAHGWVYYGFHDVILLNGTYYGFAETNQSATVLVRSANGNDVWEAFANVGGRPGWGPLELPAGVGAGWTPSGSFVDLGYDRGYGKIHVDPRDNNFYLAINTAAKTSLSPAALEAAFINPVNWKWHNGTTGPAASPILSATTEHDLRECWVVPNTNPNADWIIIYDADFGAPDGGKALGYATLTPPAPPRVHNITQGTHYNDIQPAITAANAGDVIQADAGIYNENLTIPNTKTGLLLQGAGKTTTIIKVTSSYGIIIDASNVTFNGFTVKQNAAATVQKGAGIGIGTAVSGVTISNCDFDGTGSTKSGSMGILVRRANGVIIDNVESYGWYGYGIDVYSATTPQANDVDILNSRFYNNAWYNIAVDRSTNVWIDNCTVYNGTGIAFFENATYPVTGGMVTNCTIKDSPDDGLVLVGDGILVSNNDIYNCDNAGIWITTAYWPYYTADNNTVINNCVHHTLYSVLIDYRVNPLAPEPAGNVFHNNSFTDNANGFDASVLTQSVDATCNWWGSNVPDTVASVISGNVTCIPYLDDGTDGSTAIGFQPAATCTGTCDLTVTVTTTNSCAGASNGTATATVTGGINPSYAWSPGGQTTQTLTGLAAGTYSVTVTDVNGCTVSASGTVLENPAPICSITLTPSNNTYTGGNGNTLFLGYGPQSMFVDATATGGASFTYAWTGSCLSNYNISNPVFTPTLGEGNYTLTCTVTNEGGCAATCSVVVCVLDIRVPGSNNKVYLCHIPPGNPNNSQTLSVSVNAVPAHVPGHPLDHLGKCDQSCETIGFKSTDETGELIVSEDHSISTIVFPNPFTDAFTVTVETVIQVPIQISIYDLTGRKLHKMRDVMPYAPVIVANDLRDGIYLLYVQQGSQNQKIKIVKHR